MNQYQSEPVISLRQIFSFFWRRKLIFILLPGFFLLLSFLWVRQLADMYEAEILLVPSQTESGMANLGENIGGLASLAGLNLQSSSQNQAAIALAIIESRDFVSSFINKYNLLPDLIAAKEWDSEQQVLRYDPDIYDEKNEQWKKVVGDETTEPTPWDGYGSFIQGMTVEEDSASGVISIRFEHYSPTLAKSIVENTVLELNNTMRAEAMAEARRSISYLKGEIQTTSVAGLKTVFYNLIEEQTKKLMLANVSDNYVFKVIAKPVYPEEKSSPNRVLICLIFTFFGFLIAFFVALIFEAYERN